MTLPAGADVVVVGAGVMGASVAFHLAEAGRRRRRPRARRAGAGLLRQAARRCPGPVLRPAQRRARAPEPGRVRRLRPAPGRGHRPAPGRLPVPAADRGGRRPVPRQRRRAERARRRQPAGRPGRGRGAQPLGGPRTPTPGAAFSADDGWARPAAVVEGYLAAARALGARCATRTEVLGVDRAGDRVTGVRTPAGTVATGHRRLLRGRLVAGDGRHGRGRPAGRPAAPPDRLHRPAAARPRRPRAPLPFTIDFGSTFYVHDAGDGPDAGLLLGIADPATAPGFGRDYDDAWLPTLRAAARRCTPGARRPARDLRLGRAVRDDAGPRRARGRGGRGRTGSSTPPGSPATASCRRPRSARWSATSCSA